MYTLVLPAFVSFTTPGMWAGVALAVFPFAAHLLNRYARARRTFPSLQLLRLAVAQQARITKWRRRLLLLLRCLCVIAVAAAFTRPVWRDRQAQVTAATQRNAVVLLLDTSGSMEVTRNGVRMLDVAKAAGVRVLNDLRRGVDVANVVYAGSRTLTAFPELSPNLPALQQDLQRHNGTQEVANIADALRTAGQLLAEFDGAHQLVVLSDLQVASWQSLADQAQTILLPSHTQVSVIDLGVPTARNVAIQLPRHDPQQPLVGQIVTLTAELQNHTDQVQQVRVTARVQQRELPATQVTLKPRQRRDVSLEANCDLPGFYEVVWQLNHDDFVLDDECYWVTHARPGIPVALVTDEDPAQVGSAGFYLAVALHAVQGRPRSICREDTYLPRLASVGVG